MCRSGSASFRVRYACAMGVAMVLIVSVGAALSGRLDAAAPGAPASLDAARVGAGAALANIGNCGTCHTAPGGKTLAGGRELVTPFGTIHSTNITPDPDTGIGRWSAPEFRRAMQEGIGRDGRQLYPAFPYDHYTHVVDEDVDAIYAYLMTREPVRAETPPNRTFVLRPFVGIWKALYFTSGPLLPDPAHDAEWNRGRYLTEGLGHCGACHTPRNGFGAEEPARALDGGTVDGWSAPALNAQSPAPRPWTVEQLTTYLATGYDEQHGAAAGAMASVTQNLSRVPDADVRAIAVYIAWQMRGARAEKLAASSAPSKPTSAAAAEDAVADASRTDATSGAAIYESTCAGCHERARRGIPLALSTTLADTTPANLIRITFDGIMRPEGEKGGIMPAFRGALNDRQMTALVDYLRTEIAHASAWRDVEREIARARGDRTEHKS
jgi:mono/diheme cytochrome c family protein